MEFIVSFDGQKGEKTSLSTLRRLAQGKSEVFHVKDTSVSEEYALKTFFKDDLSSKRYQREKKIISLLEHPNIIKYHPVVEHEVENDVIITEYAPMGDFFSLVTKGALSHEVHIRTYFHQLIEGLEYMHSKRVAHLDLKLENLLLGKDFLLKIIDFDQSHSIDEEQIKCTGTTSYRSPEIQNKTCKDAFAADIYSAGIILYAFKAKKFPFAEVIEDGKTTIASYDLFMDNNEEFWRTKTEKSGEKANFFSEDFKQLIRGMLERDPSRRLTIEGIKASEWFNKPILTKESLAIRMEVVCGGLDKNRNSPAVTPTTSRRSTFDSIVSVLSSPRSKPSNGPALDIKLWTCGFPKFKSEKKEGSEINSPNTASTKPGRMKKKSSFDIGFLNILSPRSKAQKSAKKGIDEETKLTTFGSSEFIKRKDSQLSNTDSPKSSTLPNRVTADIFQKAASKPAKSKWAKEKDEKIQTARQNLIPSSARRPVRVTLPEKTDIQ